MGRSVQAYVGWGALLCTDNSDESYYKPSPEVLIRYCPEWDRTLGGLMECLDSVLGWDEDYPLLGNTDEQNSWRERRKAAIPLSYSFTGDLDWSMGYVLCIGRTIQQVELGVKAISPIPMPTPDECGKLAAVLDNIGYEGSWEPRLLLWSTYSR